MKPPRAELIARLGAEVERFQDESNAFDDVAARILALERGDLPCMTSSPTSPSHAASERRAVSRRPSSA